MYGMLLNNQVAIAGEVNSEFKFNHEVFGEQFYLFELRVPRFSEVSDYIPVVISERLIDVAQNCVGQFVTVQGQYRSYNQHTGNKNKLVLSVFAREVEFIEESVVKGDSNSIYLDGFICKEPVYRKTPLGREITDLLVAVNRPYGKSDYIPCICWGRNAKFIRDAQVGGHIVIHGRIQSREYMKKLDGEQTEKKIAYEVSVSRIEYDEGTMPSED